jgi:signal transduction histidine kinase
VFLDSNRIIQVFTNLIENALKFTPEKGKVTIEARKRDKFLEVSVADTGLGIAVENLDKVFDRFEQLGQSQGAVTKGTGLGLSIAKKIIELHGGKIWVESPVKPGGKGSRFIFLLPL